MTDTRRTWPARLRVLVRPHSSRMGFLVSLILWQPLLAAAITFVLSGTPDFARRWIISLVIAEVTALQCFGASHLVRWGELAYLRARGRAAPEHSVTWYLLLSGVVLPFALPLGFRVSRWVGAAMGIHRAAPDFASYRTGIGIGIAMMLIFFFERTRNEAREAMRLADSRIRDLENARLQAQLAALTAEMNPHLLFNALNTVASLIQSDPQRAEEVVLRLSDLYRGLLRSSGAQTHSLHEELRLCKAYLDIEHARFGQRLVVDVAVDAAVDAHAVQLPVLLIQPIVENAVKHGVSHRARGGSIVVRAQAEPPSLRVTIEDDGVGYGNSPYHGAGKAMTNCEARLMLAYGDRGRLEVEPRADGGTRVTVSLPLEGRSNP